MWRHTMWSTRAVVMTLGLLAAPAAGQFREIPPQQPRSAKLKLAPTDQPFVAPPTPEETLSATGDAPADPEPGASNTPAPNAPDSPGVPPATKSDQPPAANPTDGTEPQGQLAPVVSPPTGRAPVVSSSDRPVTPRSDMTPAAPPKASESTASEPPAAPIAPSDQTSQGKPVPSESGTSDAIASEEQQSPPADAQESWRAALPVPESDAKPAPVAFNKIEPGRSLISDVRAKWGEPLDQVSLGEELWLLYRVPGFEQVDVAQAADGQTVRSIVIHLQQPVAIADLERYLSLQSGTGFDVKDGSGEVIGRAYPEYGVLLPVDSSAPEGPVTQVLLEPLSGELFRLRAELDEQNAYERGIADLEEATRLDPEDAKAFWLQAELLTRIGKYDDALASAKVATRIRPDSRLYRLTEARLLAEMGQVQVALRKTRSVTSDPLTPTHVQARAEYQLGNLLSMGPEPDYQQALAHHLKAVQLAAGHVHDKRVAVRQMAKDVLVDTHLAIAQDIALGNFQKKEQVVPKWLARATQLAEDLVTREGADPIVRMEVYRTTLAVYTLLQGDFDVALATQEAVKQGKRLIAEAADTLYQHRVEREVAESLLHAARISHQQEEAETAMTLANNAVALLENQPAELQPSLVDRIVRGQLYFLVGSLYAVDRSDHAEAVEWYERAKPMFADEHLDELADSSSFGDLFVSMGVSYWEIGEREKAVELTRLGAELMQRAVQAGNLDIIALSVPYGNLSAMLSTLGEPDQAKHFAQLMAKVEQESGTRR